MANKITIAGCHIGLDEPCFVIAEVAQAHDGSLGMAHAFIDAAADVGADAIKFQTHIAAAESTLDEPFRVKFSLQDDTRFDYWKRMEFTADQWCGLAQHAQKRNIVFISSPFSVEAVKLLSELGVSAWKVGSGETRSAALVTAMIEQGGPILLSTGMSSWRDIDDSITLLTQHDRDFVLMQCTSRYPTPLSEVGLNVLDEMRQRYHCLVGLSDHSSSPFSAIAAINRGASVVEVHVTFDRRLFGPDTVASVTFDELGQIVRARDAFYEIDTHPVDKDEMAGRLKDLRVTFGKSIATNEPLSAGTVLRREMLTFKKPASGIPPDALDSLVGRRLIHDVFPDKLLRWEDLDVQA